MSGSEFKEVPNNVPQIRHRRPGDRVAIGVVEPTLVTAPIVPAVHKLRDFPAAISATEPSPGYVIGKLVLCRELPGQNLPEKSMKARGIAIVEYVRVCTPWSKLGRRLKRKHEVYSFRLLPTPFGEIADIELGATQAKTINFLCQLVCARAVLEEHRF